MIKIINNGPHIAETTYWDTPHARAGYVFASINAGAIRLLVPDGRLGDLEEMRSARLVVVSAGPWQGHDALEFLFEDDTDTPFALHILAAQSDRRMAAEDHGKPMTCTVWTRSGLQLSFPGVCRRAPKLPWLKPWTGAE